MDSGVHADPGAVPMLCNGSSINVRIWGKINACWERGSVLRTITYNMGSEIPIVAVCAAMRTLHIRMRVNNAHSLQL